MGWTYFITYNMQESAFFHFSNNGKMRISGRTTKK